MLYAQSLGLAKTLLYPLKPLSSQAIKSHAGKANYEPKAQNETMQHRILPILILISTKRKEKGHEKRRSSTPEARKREKMKKNRKKVKRKQITLN